MKKFTKIIICAALICTLIFQLIFLYNIKYTNQSLPVSEFRIYNIGNLLNLIVVFILVLGIAVYALQRKNKVTLSGLIIFTSITTIILAGAYYSTKVNLPFQKFYYFGQFGNKLFIGFLFVLYINLLLTFSSYIWLSLFGRNSFLLIRSFLSSWVILFILLLFAFYHVNVSDPQIDNKMLDPDDKNIAVVLGAAVWSQNKPSPILAARVDKAIQLLDSNLVGRIQLTGSNAPGELSEALVAYNYALSRGVDSSRIFMESKTISTYEQIHFIRAKLMPEKSVKNVIVVSDNFHLVRIEECSIFNNMKIYAVASDLKLNFEKEIYNRLRESIGLFFFWFFAV
jgi:vancomycin permeability regulator SanA